MGHDTRRRRRLCAALIGCTGAVVALGAAGTALGAEPADQRAASLEAVAAANAASGRAVLQGAERPMPRPSEGHGMRAVTASNIFFDAIGDSSLAPDLRQMLPFTSDDGRYTVGITLDSNALVDGDSVMTFVNTDGNAATGEPTFGGAEVAVSIVGQTGQDAVVTMRWNGAGWEPADFPSLISFWSGATDEVWSISAAELGIAPGTPTTLSFAAMYAGYYDDYFDFAPEPGFAPFVFTTGGGAPPPPPPPVAPAPVALTPPGPPATAARRPAASPLVVRAFTAKTTGRSLRMRIGWVRGTGRVTWTVRLRANIAGRQRTKLIRGAGRAGNRVITRTVPLPRSWAGATVRAQLTVKGGGRTITRNRALRV